MKYKVIFASLMLFFSVVAHANELDQNLSKRSEALLLSALSNILNSNPDAALTSLNNLNKINPTFALSKLVYTDVLQAKNDNIIGFGNDPDLNNKQITELKEELLARWNYSQKSIDPRLIPAGLLKASNNQGFLFIVDQSLNRLFIYENIKNVPTYVNDFYVSLGKNGSGKTLEGDKKTPTGAYFITRSIDPSTLPEFYGDGAYPINYPNIQDKRMRRTGSGIWLHGTPKKVFSRPPLASDGCIVLSNDALKHIKPYISEHQKTPFILSKKMQMLTQDEWEEQQVNFMAQIDQWKKDWESRNNDSYLRHYSKSFKSAKKNYAQWVSHKRRVNASKKYIRIKLSNISAFRQTDHNADVMVVTFTQQYVSDSYQSQNRKRMYWKKEKGIWRIIYEGSM